MQILAQDLRYALRQLKHSPGFTLAAILTLGIGIGVNTAVFSLLQQALLQQLPVRNPSELVEVRFAGANPGHTSSEGGDTPDAHAYFSYPAYRDLRDRSSALNGLIAFSSAEIGFSFKNHSALVTSELVTGNYFLVLGVRPALGRLFSPGDEMSKDGNPVAVLSYNYWSAHLGADKAILNKTVRLNGFPFIVVGVAAKGYSSARWGNTPAVFLPLTMKREVTPDGDDLNDRRSQWLNIIGRLQPNQTRSRTEASVNPVWYGIRSEEFRELPDQMASAREAFLGKTHLTLLDGSKGFSPMRADLQTPLLLIMGMAILVLAMACVNTASLVLVRAATRVPEFSMRYALGASRARVLSQLLLEGFLLSSMGSLVGVSTVPGIIKILSAWLGDASTETPFHESFDLRMLCFALAITLVTTVLSSLAPAASFWRQDSLASIRRHGSTDGAGSLAFRRTCVVLQISLSFTLLVGAGLFTRTIENLRRVNTGMQTSHLITFSVNAQFSGYNASEAIRLRQRIQDSIAALPSIRSVAATSDPELANNSISGDITIAGYNVKEDENMDAELPFVTPGYFSTLGIQFVCGRDFIPSDTAKSQKVAIVNEALALHYFGGARNALGHFVSHNGKPDVVIIGVVKDSRHSSPRDAIIRTVYSPILQIGEGAVSPLGFAFYVRTAQTPDAVLSLIRRALHNTDANLVVDNLRTMASQIDDCLTNERVVARLAASFGIIATLLAAIGLYGVLAYVTSQRTREIGIRMAIGAQPRVVAGLILREVLLLTAVSFAFAIPVSMLLGQMLRSQLFNVSNTDFLTYAEGIGVVTFVVVVAATIPMRRAATVDPVRALRA